MPAAVRRRLNSAHLLAFVAIVLACAVPAGAARVTAKELSNNAVLSRHIKNGQVRTADIGRRAVTNRNLGLRAVKGNNLSPGSVGASQIADGSITAADLAPGTLPTFSIGAGTITAAMLATGSVGSAAIADGSIGTADLGTGVVTAAKIATGAVGEAEIGAGAVDSIELADGAVLAQHMADSSVTGAALGQVVGAGARLITPTAITDEGGTWDADLAAEEADGVALSFDSEEFDTASMFDLGGTADRLVAPSAGLYDVRAWVSWEADNDGYREAQIIRNDGTIMAQVRNGNVNSANGNRTNQSLSALVPLGAGDSVLLRVSHSAGSSTFSVDRARLTSVRIGSLT